MIVMMFDIKCQNMTMEMEDSIFVITDISIIVVTIAIVIALLILFTIISVIAILIIRRE